MKISHFNWDEENVNHIARHGVDPEEVEEVFENSCLIALGRNGAYLAFGRADSGRFLIVVFRYLGNASALTITARDMSEREKRYFRKRCENG